mmetsp:Transcript_3571/g.5531  ORF Transcript_3571/g.5531 Transcript_3571/m.5531 type:complete len:302 (-) Transcript_3571:4340-5245(-)
MIFVEDLNSTELGLKMGPKDMGKRDIDELFNAALDVAELPGTSSPKYVRAEAQQEAEIDGAVWVAQAVVSASSGSNTQLYDQTWQLYQRHGLRHVKDGATLLEIVKSVNRSRENAFAKFENHIRAFMQVRNYSSSESIRYLCSGLLPRIIHSTNENYFALLAQTRELHLAHTDFWEGGPAASLITYHSEKLLMARLHAVHRRDFILQMHVYLQDSAQKQFYHDTTTESLWGHIASLATAMGWERVTEVLVVEEEMEERFETVVMEVGEEMEAMVGEEVAVPSPQYAAIARVEPYIRNLTWE